MAAGIPTDLARTVDAYRTCELATVTRAGVPIAWPTATLYDEASGSFTVTTSIGLPTKAVNIRREPRVAMLFSDPTGSGSSVLPQVLVRGRATCPDVIRTDPAGLEAYWRRLYERQPAGRVFGRNAATRRLMDWYYFRLVITVTPESVRVSDPVPSQGPLDVGVRLAPPGVSRAVRSLARFSTAVLCWIDADGGPSATRVRPTPAPAGGLAVAADGLRAGPASLLCHSHDEQLWSQRSLVTVGTVDQHDGGWVFTPERLVPGASQRPVDALRMLRTGRATTNRYLANRGLRRPSVAWQEFAALHSGGAAERGIDAHSANT